MATAMATKETMVHSDLAQGVHIMGCAAIHLWVAAGFLFHGSVRDDLIGLI